MPACTVHFCKDILLYYMFLSKSGAFVISIESVSINKYSAAQHLCPIAPLPRFSTLNVNVSVKPQ